MLYKYPTLYKIRSSMSINSIIMSINSIIMSMSINSIILISLSYNKC